jgi:hypothetical protein
VSDFWWQAKPAELDESVFRYVKALEEQQVDVRQEGLRHARLYANYNPPGLDLRATGNARWRRNSTAVSENVIESVIDTMVSLVGKNRPRPTFMTDGADWKTQRKAKKLEKFIAGIFQKAKVYSKTPVMARDAGIFGWGTLKVCENGDEISVERVMYDELIVDELECRNGKLPRQLHQRKIIDKDVLKSMFPKLADKIEVIASKTTARSYVSYISLDTNQLPVIESWHLPSKKGAGDGRHTICIDGLVLKDEEYEDDDFPFVVLRYSDPVSGFYGKGLAAMLVGIQLRIHKLNKFIDECQDIIAVPRVFMDVAGKPPKAQLSDKIGQIIPTRGKGPTFYTPPAVAPETYQRLNDLKRSAYELAGITQLSASGKKPGGIESAVALREYNDIETQRFSIFAMRYEEAHLEIARHVVRIAKRMHAKGKSLKSVYADRKFVETIPWKDVDLDEDVFTMGIEASSMLSRTPAGRMQGVTEMMTAGLLKPEEGRRLLGHPDLEREMDIQNAAIDDIEAVIENLLEGKQETPEPFQDLVRGVQRVQLAYLKAKREGYPHDRLEGLRRWMALAKYELDKAAGAGPAPAPGGANAATPKTAMAPQAMALAPVG